MKRWLDWKSSGCCCSCEGAKGWDRMSWELGRQEEKRATRDTDGGSIVRGDWEGDPTVEDMVIGSTDMSSDVRRGSGGCGEGCDWRREKMGTE